MQRGRTATGKESTLRQVVGSNHRTVSTYFNDLRRHGLTLEALHEPRPDADLVERSPEMASYPIYLVAEFRKIEAAAEPQLPHLPGRANGPWPARR